LTGKTRSIWTLPPIVRNIFYTESESDAKGALGVEEEDESFVLRNKKKTKKNRDDDSMPIGGHKEEGGII